MKLNKRLCKKCFIENRYTWDENNEREWKRGFCICPRFANPPDGGYAIQHNIPEGNMYMLDNCPYITEQIVLQENNQ